LLLRVCGRAFANNKKKKKGRDAQAHAPLFCSSFQVKRSRENARMRREVYERKCRERERENRTLKAEVSTLREKIVLLAKVRCDCGQR
jgi:hypothetical protein